MIDYKKLVVHTGNLSLLLVEDYEPLRNDLAEVMEDLFERVVVASNGVEGLKCYREHASAQGEPFDIVISDIVMPYMNGVDLCEILRAENEAQEIIILSAHTDSEYLLRLINLGIAQFINKPIEEKKLFDTLAKVCEKIKKEIVVVEESPIIYLGENVLWHKKNRILQRDKYPVSLTRHEIVLMQLFVEKVEQICTNDEVQQYFYLEGIDLSENNIRNLIFKLRKKLPSTAVSSIYGLGYKLTLPQ